MDSDQHSVCCCDKSIALNDKFILELYICFGFTKLNYYIHAISKGFKVLANISF